MKSNIKIIFLLVLILFFSIFSGWYFVKKNRINNLNELNNENENRMEDHIIANVPYFGIYNHMKPYHFIPEDVIAAYISVLAYWQQEKEGLLEFYHKSIGGSSPNFFIGAENYLTEKGFSLEQKQIDVDDLGMFINSAAPVPLITFLPASPGQPDYLNYASAVVIVGINYSQQKVTLHDYWKGNDYEISFEDYRKLQEKRKPGQKNSYTIIQPEDMSGKLKKMEGIKLEANSQRTSIMENAGDLFGSYVLGRANFNYGMYDESLKYYLEVVNAPNFQEYFPPYFKVVVLSQIGDIYLEKNDFVNALLWTERAEENNHDLNQPWKDWPGYEDFNINSEVPGKVSEVLRLQGDIYAAKGETEKAKEYYDQAMKIYANNEKAKIGIQKLGQ